MNEIVWHVLLIWFLLATTLVLAYEKLVVQRQMEHNMYTGKGRSYDKRKARSTFFKIILLSGVMASLAVYFLSFTA